MKYIFYASTMLLLFTSCLKNHGAQSGPGEGFWELRFNDNHFDRYEISTTERNSNRHYFILSGKPSASSENVLQIYFHTQPVSSGKYKVVAFIESPGLKPNEIGINAYIPTAGTYSSTGIANNITWLPALDVDVTVTNNKIDVDIPRMTAVISRPSYGDSVFLHGHITEK